MLPYAKPILSPNPKGKVVCGVSWCTLYGVCMVTSGSKIIFKIIGQQEINSSEIFNPYRFYGSKYLIRGQTTYSCPNWGKWWTQSFTDITEFKSAHTPNIRNHFSQKFQFIRHQKTQLQDIKLQETSSLWSQCLQSYNFLRDWLPETPAHFDPSVTPINSLSGVCNEWGCGHELKKDKRVPLPLPSLFSSLLGEM